MRHLFWCVGLFLGAWALRLAHLATLSGSVFYGRLMLDPLFYDEWGRRIAGGEWLGDRVFFQDPLYAYLLGAIYALFGHHIVPVLLLQGLLGAAVAPLVYAAVRRGFGPTEAKVAGVMAAVYPPSIYYEGLLEKTSFTVFWVAVALWLLAKAYDGAGRRAWFGSGICLGLASLTRGNLVLVPPVLAGAAAMPDSHASRKSNDRRAWQRAAALLIGGGLVIVPTTLRNRWVGGEWILTTSNAGQNFYIGNNPHNEDGEYALLPFVDPDPSHEERDFAREAERRLGHTLSPKEISSFWFGEARKWIADHPGDWLRLSWLKVRNFWGAFEIPDNLDYYLYRRSAPLLRLPLPGFGLIAPLGLAGAWLAIRRPGWPRAALLFVVTYCGSVVLFFVFSRFRMPMMPALFAFAAFGMIELVRRWRLAFAEGQRRPAVAATLLFAAAFVFVNVPVRAMADSWSFRIASQVGLPVERETSATAHFNLGLVYAAEAKEAGESAELLQRAAAELRQAVEEGASYTKVYVELGKVLARQHRDREAIEAYEQARNLEPGLHHAHYALGLLYRRVGDLAAAEEAFRQALKVAPAHAPSAVRLGEVLLARSKPQEAAAAFRRALEIKPGDPEALAGLAAAGSLERQAE